MDLKYLNTFRTIVEEGSFSRAAERLNYTQSTITFQMGQLEGELSAQLFEKVGRRMVLSQAGRRLLPYVDQVLDAVDQMRFFQEDLTQCRGEITIGVAETLVRDYRVDLLLNGAVVASQSVTANHQRRNTVTWPHVECDQVRRTVLATNGCADARVYEIRVY